MKTTIKGGDKFMRKIIGIVLAFVLMLGLCISVFALKTKTIDELLVPYQVAIDKVNADISSNFFIPDSTKEEVYNNIKSKSPDELEALLRQQYKTFRTQAKSDNYTSISGMGKGLPGLGPIPNFTGPIHVTPL
jgi:hypothetical protein